MTLRLTPRPRAPFKVGLIGLGKVGKNTLRQVRDGAGGPLELHWVADSRYLVSMRGEAFSRTGIAKLLRAKERRSVDFGAACEEGIRGVEVRSYDGAAEEARLLTGEMADPREWIILDTSATKADADYKIASAIMGAAGFCTASKSPWADYPSCSRLFAQAEKGRTLLGLNCTTGVWVDQMEILPLVASELRTGRVSITKRDNSSFNLFFSELSSSRSPEEALREIEAAGFLEPDADGLKAEIRDQVVKAKVAENFCALARGLEPTFSDNSHVRPEGLSSISPADIARWYLEGRRRGRFPALVSRIFVEAGGLGGGSIRCSISFEELPRGHKLARRFPGKTAILVERSPGTTFGWGDRLVQGAGDGYLHSGFGGAPRTAAKLIWEARRIARLSRHGDASSFSPLPVLFSLALGERSAVALKGRVAARL